MFFTFSLLFFLSIFQALTVSANLACTAESFNDTLPANTTIRLIGEAKTLGEFTRGGLNITFDSTIPSEALPICVLQLRVASSTNTSFETGVFLPNNWNGRLLATGNPGFTGGLRWSFQIDTLRYGPSVTISTDTGHSGANISWAVNNPESIIDWAYRSLHESTVLAKQIAKTYYGSDVQHSYFTACSNGGRQGMKEVQMFPEDYDGVLAGAAPLELTHLHPYMVQLGIWNLPSTAVGHIPPNKFKLISNFIMEQCDAQDGLVDGIISEPYRCNFSSTAILCNTTNPETNNCLTEDEVNTLSLFYNDWVATDGSLLAPHFPISASVDAYSEVTNAPDGFGLEYLEGFVYNNTNWNWTNFQGQETVAFADSINAGDADATSTDLSGFKANGGKLIMYHGLADTTIPTGSTINYFQEVNATMGPLDDFFKMYLIPGMGHCHEAAVAPYYIAGNDQTLNTANGKAFSVPGYSDPQHDVLLAMFAWVENGTAPEQLIATKWLNDTLEDGIVAQRPLCPYPQRSVYSGSGNWNETANWSCTSGETVLFPAPNGTVGTVPAVVNSTKSSSTGPGTMTAVGNSTNASPTGLSTVAAVSDSTNDSTDASSARLLLPRSLIVLCCEIFVLIITSSLLAY